MSNKYLAITWEEFLKDFEYVYQKTIEKENYNDFVPLKWYTKGLDVKGREYRIEDDKLVCEMCDGWMELSAILFDEEEEEEEFYYINENYENPEEIVKYNTSPYPFEKKKKFLTRDKEYVLGLFYKFYHDLDGAIEEIKETFL